MTETLALASIIFLVALGCGIGFLVLFLPLIDHWKEKRKEKRARPS